MPKLQKHKIKFFYIENRIYLYFWWWIGSFE